MFKQETLKQTRENAIVDGLDYLIPFSQLRGVRGRWRCESSKATILHTPKQRHLSSIPLFAYKFLMDG